MLVEIKENISYLKEMLKRKDIKEEWVKQYDNMTIKCKWRQINNTFLFNIALFDKDKVIMSYPIYSGRADVLEQDLLKFYHIIEKEFGITYRDVLINKSADELNETDKARVKYNLLKAIKPYKYKEVRGRDKQISDVFYITRDVAAVLVYNSTHIQLYFAKWIEGKRVNEWSHKTFNVCDITDIPENAVNKVANFVNSEIERMTTSKRAAEKGMFSLQYSIDGELSSAKDCKREDIIKIAHLTLKEYGTNNLDYFYIYRQNKRNKVSYDKRLNKYVFIPYESNRYKIAYAKLGCALNELERVR